MAQSLNPYAVLARGYAMVEKDGVVCEVAALHPGEAITLRGAKAVGRLRGAERCTKTRRE